MGIARYKSLLTGATLDSGNMLLMTWAQARFSGDTHIAMTYV